MTSSSSARSAIADSSRPRMTIISRTNATPAARLAASQRRTPGRHHGRPADGPHACVQDRCDRSADRDDIDQAQDRRGTMTWLSIRDSSRQTTSRAS